MAISIIFFSFSVTLANDVSANEADLARLASARTFSIAQLLLKPDVLEPLDLSGKQAEMIRELAKRRAQQWASDYAEDIGALKAGINVEKLLKDRRDVEQDREDELVEKLEEILNAEQELAIAEAMIRTRDLSAYAHPWGRSVLGLTREQQTKLRRLSNELRVLPDKIRTREGHAAAAEAGDLKRLKQIQARVVDALIRQGVKLYEILTPQQLSHAYRLNGMLGKDETLREYVTRQKEPFRSLALEALRSHQK